MQIEATKDRDIIEEYSEWALAKELYIKGYYGRRCFRWNTSLYSLAYCDIGWAMECENFYNNQKELHLLMIFVTKGWRNQGIGRRLIDSLMTIIDPSILLFDNWESPKFWEKVTIDYPTLHGYRNEEAENKTRA